MFGQRASSQIVCRLAPWMSCRTSAYREFALGPRTFIHSGRRGRSATGRELSTSGSVRTMVPEAPLEETEHGRVPAGEGWFVLNARDARWQVNELGAYCGFEGDARFPQLGINISVLQPGQPMSMYHWEADQ